MIYTTKQLLALGETQYSIKNKVIDGSLHIVSRGVYSDDEQQGAISESFITQKYQGVIITGISAFYLYGLTDYVPDHCYIATAQHSYPINNSKIKQSYQNKTTLEVGVAYLDTKDGTVRTYDLERLLIELLRLKEKYPKEIYYEVLQSFRKIKNRIDFYKINQYLKSFNNCNSLVNKIKELI